MSRNLTNINSSIRTLNNLEHTSLAGTNLNKIGNTINLDSDIINIDTINTFKIGLTLNNTDNQFLVKSISYSDGDILQIDSNNKLNKITIASILGNIVAGANITKTNNTLNLDTDLTNLDSINTFKIGLSASNNNSTLLRNSEVLSNGDYLQINSSGFVEGVSLKENKNAILGSDNTSGIIVGSNMSKSIDATNGDITLSSTNTEYTVVSPLTISNNAISLSTLTNFGGAGKILKVNINNNAFEYADETNTTYTAGTNITISNQNAINLDTDLTDLLSANITNTILLGTTSNPNNRKMVIDGDLEIKDNSIFFTGGGGLIFNDDNNSVISRDAPNNINKFGNMLDLTEILSLTGAKFIFPNSLIIKIDGNATSEISLLRNNGSLTNDDYLKINSTGKVVGVQNIPYSDITGAPSIPTTLFSKSGNNINPINTTDNLLIGTTLNPNLRKVVIEGLTIEEPYFHYGALEIKNSSIFFTSGGGMIVNDAGQAVISRTSGVNIFGENNSITTINGSKSVFSNRIETSSDLKFTGSGGMIRNSQGDAIIQRSNGLNKNIFGVLGDITEILGSKMTFSSDSLNYLNYDSNIGGKIGINLIGNYALKMGLSGTPTGSNEASIVLEGQNVNVVGDIKTLDDVFCEGSIRILSPAAFLPAPETQYDNYINYGLGYATGPDIHGYRGVKLWARDGNNTDDIRFYISSGVCNMRVPYALVNGNLVQTSDDRLKTDEIDFTFNSLEIINRMKPKQYKKYNENGEFLYMELGMVAQDTWNSVKDIELLRDIFVNKIDYNLESNFKEDGDLIEDQQKIGENGEIEVNYLYVNYISYIPILIQSVKDLNTIVKQQQEQINQQQIIIDKLINSSTFANFRKTI